MPVCRSRPGAFKLDNSLVKAGADSAECCDDDVNLVLRWVVLFCHRGAGYWYRPEDLDICTDPGTVKDPDDTGTGYPWRCYISDVQGADVV